MSIARLAGHTNLLTKEKCSCEKAAKELNVPFLGRIPFDPRIVETTDDGKPFIEMYPDSESAKVLDKICSSIDEKIRKRL